METKINMTVSDLKRIIADLPDDMAVIIPVILEEDCNTILGLRHVRTAGILYSEWEEEYPRVLCLNASAYGVDISTQVKSRDCICEKILF
jgi:hypothetical protein